jgi:hypothetical protein
MPLELTVVNSVLPAKLISKGIIIANVSIKEGIPHSARYMHSIGSYCVILTVSQASTAAVEIDLQDPEQQSNAMYRADAASMFCLVRLVEDVSCALLYPSHESC